MTSSIGRSIAIIQWRQKVALRLAELCTDIWRSSPQPLMTRCCEGQTKWGSFGKGFRLHQGKRLHIDWKKDKNDFLIHETKWFLSNQKIKDLTSNRNIAATRIWRTYRKSGEKYNFLTISKTARDQIEKFCSWTCQAWQELRVHEEELRETLPQEPTSKEADASLNACTAGIDSISPLSSISWSPDFRFVLSFHFQLRHRICAILTSLTKEQDEAGEALKWKIRKKTEFSHVELGVNKIREKKYLVLF